MTDLTALFHDLVRFETELWNAVEARLLADHDLSLGKFETMRIIAAIPSCRVQDLAQELSITVGGVSKIVDRLVALGHCRREPHPVDGRSSAIVLTPAGARLLKRSRVSFEDELTRQLKAPPRELAQLASTLTHLRKASS